MGNIHRHIKTAASVSIIAIVSCQASLFAQQSTASSESSINNTEIVVTATRQSERLSRVPISVSAFNSETMQKIGVKQVDDLVRLTPGLALQRGPTGSNSVSIRGISSDAGAGVTGVYIDDVPIQVRNLGYGSGTAFPEIFDLERVEVLRGPQGTLFGAGSEGGTVRFIQARPNMKDWSVYARGELADTKHGAATYEGGLALGGPIIEDKIGFRANVYYRREGGYIDAVDGVVSPVIDQGTGQPPIGEFPNANLVDFTKTRTVRKDSNSSDAYTARLAVELHPTEWLSITPSYSYQKVHLNDGGDTFWTSTSNLGARDYSRVVFSQGSAASNPALTDVNLSDKETGNDRFHLWSLAATADLGGVDLISNTSYFNRRSTRWLDFTQTDAFQFAGQFSPAPGFKSASLYDVRQKNFVQELRLQSTDRESPLRWVAGAFYSKNKQSSSQEIGNNFVDNLPVVFGVPADGDPFGPGTSALVNALGVPLLPNGGSYAENRSLVEKQYAAFGQLDFRPIEKLTLTAGVRVSRNKLSFDGVFRGPLNNDNPPLGAPCPAGETCTPGSGTFAPVFQDTVGFKNSETAVTPKFGIAYQATPNDLYYASVSKGFRPAGVNAKVPAAFCGSDLATTGYQGANGQSTQPINYGSDSVWSYEVGAKSRTLGGALSIDASAYYIKWSNIQTQVFLPTCLYDFVDNLGTATSKGFDLNLQLEPVANLQLGANISYNDSYYDDAVLTPGNVALYPKKSPIRGSRPWTITLSGQYDWDRYYVRADGSYLSRARKFSQTDPQSALFDPNMEPDEAYAFLNMRAGVRMGDADLSLFVDNVTNAAPIFNTTRQANRAVYTAQSLRPRTVGVTLSFRR